MNRVVIIGASGGIGHAVAKLLLENNYSVVGTYSQGAENLKNLNGNSNFRSGFLDLQDVNSIKEFFNELEGEIYAVVNCSGIVDFEENDIDRDFAIWNKTIAINLSGNYFLGKIIKDKISVGGRFIMISSTDSFYGGTSTVSYAASKSGVNSLTKSFSLLFADRKIRVNTIAPGWVLTPMTESSGEEFLAKIADMNPLKRNAEPQDVANLIDFLLSDKAEYINGQIIPIEGGYTNQDPTLLIEESIKEKSIGQ